MELTLTLVGLAALVAAIWIHNAPQREDFR
jgi:hypothetical protein